MDLPINYEKAHRSERRKARQLYVEKQKGRCFFCNELLTDPPPAAITESSIDWDLFPSGFLDYPLHLQHCHKTGMTEGTVHAYCNAYLWIYEGR